MCVCNASETWRTHQTRNNYNNNSKKKKEEKMVGRTRENGRGTINSRPKIKPRKGGGSKKLNDVMEVVVFVWLCCWPMRNCCPCAKKKRYLHFWPYWNWKMMSFTLILKKLLFDSIRRIQVGRWLWSAKPARKRGQQQTTRQDSRGLSSKGVSDTSEKGC